MGVNQNHITQLLGLSSNQSQIIYEQSSPQLNLILQSKLELSKFQEILRKIIIKASLLAQTNYNQWDKLDSQLYKQRQLFIQNVFGMITNLNFTDSIDQGTKSRLNSKFHQLCKKSFQFKKYIFSVKTAISYPDIVYCPILHKYVQKKRENIVWEDKDLDLQVDEYVWQENTEKIVMKAQENIQQMRDQVSKIQKLNIENENK